MIRTVSAFLYLGLSLITPLCAQDTTESLLAKYREKATEKWEADIQKLEKIDQSQPDPADPILFLGSSSIRMWKDLAADMAPWNVLNRGYGGATFGDLAVYIDRLMGAHRCRAVVLFVGNDVVGKPDDKSPEEVGRLFEYVVQRIRRTHPTQPIFMVAVTPTPSRFKVWPEIRNVNATLEQVCKSREGLHFIATESHYLTEDQTPIEKYFVEDKLHQNRDGYLVWGSIIKSRLAEVLQ